VGPGAEQVVKGNDPHGGRGWLCEIWLVSDLVLLHLFAYEDGTECSETSAYTIQTPGNYPEENIQGLG
jgi:hypothetical protein